LQVRRPRGRGWLGARWWGEVKWGTDRYFRSDKGVKVGRDIDAGGGVGFVHAGTEANVCVCLGWVAVRGDLQRAGIRFRCNSHPDSVLRTTVMRCCVESFIGQIC